VRLAHTCLIAAIIASLFLTSCDPTQNQNTLHTEQMLIEGMLISITYYDQTPAKIEPANRAAEAEIQRFYSKITVWRESPLTRINQHLEKGEPATIDAEIAYLIRRSQQLETASDGLFNPAIGHWITQWGFHQDTLPTKPLNAAQISAMLAQRPSTQHIKIQNNIITTHQRNLNLDFGAIAEGYALALTEKILQNHGIQHALINAAGDIRALGRHGTRPWRVGIRNPKGNNTPIATLDVLPGETVETSGNYERYFETNGKRYHHIIDPRTGHPTEGALAVTVIGTDPVLADAAATALMVAGVNEWIRIAKRMGIRHVLLMDPQGQLHVSQEMAARIQLDMPSPPKVVIHDFAQK
jgi:FAD:protein FMN transferase